MKGYYDAKVRGVSFRPGDFMYRANNASHVEDTGKLGPKWEGPYEVTEVLGKGAYKLRDMDGRDGGDVADDGMVMRVVVLMAAVGGAARWMGRGYNGGVVEMKVGQR
ncbi:hypothetical protein Tco_1170834, partial [Tanacetum coccineum]